MALDAFANAVWTAGTRTLASGTPGTPSTQADLIAQAVWAAATRTLYTAPYWTTYWLDGAPFVSRTDLNTGTPTYWLDGGPFVVKWSGASPPPPPPPATYYAAALFPCTM